MQVTIILLQACAHINVKDRTAQAMAEVHVAPDYSVLKDVLHRYLNRPKMVDFLIFLGEMHQFMYGSPTILTA